MDTFTILIPAGTGWYRYGEFIIKRAFPSGYFLSQPESVPAAGNGELAAHAQLSPFISTGVPGTDMHICSKERAKHMRPSLHSLQPARKGKRQLRIAIGITEYPLKILVDGGGGGL